MSVASVVEPGSVRALETGGVVIVQEHGGALARGNGRAASPVRKAMRELRDQANKSVATLVAIRDDTSVSAEHRIKAAVAIMQLAQAGQRQKNRTGSTFTVARRTPAQMQQDEAPSQK